MSEICPLCHQTNYQKQMGRGRSFFIECGYCGRFSIDHILFQIGQKEWLHHEHHLLRAAVQEATDRDEIIHFPYPGNGVQQIVDRCPRGIDEKAHKLLERIIARSPQFGSTLRTQHDEFAIYSYAASTEEAYALLAYLKELGYVNAEWYSDTGAVQVKAAGHKAVEQRTLLTPLSVFISSTCYDLLDLRAELTTYLEARGSLVKASEDPEHFIVDPTADSIETCFRNIDASDIVVCLIDKRYGPVLGKGEYQEVSATHAEIIYARKCSPPKPILFFARERALSDYSILKTAPDSKTKWVEPENADQRKRWAQFVNYIAKLPEHKERSNWVTPFRSSVDLKPLVMKQLADFRHH